MEYYIDAVGDPEPWAYWDDAFSTEELDWLQKKTKQASLSAQIGNEDQNVNNIERRTLVEWLYPSQENKWVFEKLSKIISKNNANYFHFNITGFAEPIQLTNYLSNNNGHYTWHTDNGSMLTRKLSLVLQLSYPDEFTGGDLELKLSSKDNVVEKKRGRVIMFPSWTCHRVTPVTSGTRQTLVAWISGPRFR
jgi:PKHD-type hydroxylase